MKAKVKGKVGEMLRGPGGVSGCCGKAGQLAELRLEPGCEEWMVMVVDGRAGRSVGCEVCVLILVLPWQQASEAGRGRVELQL